MTKLLKNKKVLIFGLFLFLFSFLLASCKQETKKDVELVSFTATKETYDYKDPITFAIKFENKKNYIINSVDINNKTYSVYCSDADYSLVYVKDSNLIFTIGNEKYTLTSFSYTKTIDGKNEVVKEECSKKCYVSHSLVVTEDIKLKSYSFKSKSADLKYYINEEVEVSVDLINDSAYEVSKFDIKFVESETNEETTITQVVFSKNSKNENTNYTFKINLPEAYSTYKIYIDTVYYTKDTKLQKCNFTIEKPLELEIGKREIEVVEFGFDDLGADIGKDINKNYYTDSSSVVKLKIKIKNPSKVEIKSLIINGLEYKVSDMEKPTTNNYANITTYKVKVRLNSVDSAGSITSYKIKLESVRFVDKTENELLIPVSNNMNVNVYDKIINSVDDLVSLKVDEANKKITGNYILNSNITLAKKDIKYLFNDYTFDGIFEGNGKTISFTSDCILEKPMFKEIGKTGIVKNLIFGTGVIKNTNLITDVNGGIIKNIQSSINTTHTPTAVHGQTVRGGLVGENNGYILDILLKGSFKISGSNISKTLYSFSLICDKNNGNINRVVNNITSIEGSETIGNSLLFLTCRENNGTVNAIVFSSTSINLTKSKPMIIVSDSHIAGENSVFSDVFINTIFIENIAIKSSIKADDSALDKVYNVALETGNELIEKLKNGNVTTSDITYNYWIVLNSKKCLVEYVTPLEMGKESDKIEATNFYAMLLFASGGTDNFWQYNNSFIHFNFALNN